MYEKHADHLLVGGAAPANEAPVAAPPAHTARPAWPETGQAAPARTLKLPLLRPRPGYVIGRTVFEDGRPVPEATISALGYDGQINLFPGSTPSLGTAKAQNGTYAIRTLDTFRHQTPVSATVSSV